MSQKLKQLSTMKVKATEEKQAKTVRPWPTDLNSTQKDDEVVEELVKECHPLGIVEKSHLIRQTETNKKRVNGWQHSINPSKCCSFQIHVTNKTPQLTHMFVLGFWKSILKRNISQLQIQISFQWNMWKHYKFHIFLKNILQI